MSARFAALIEVALERVLVMADIFEQQARLCEERWARRYLFFLAAKKREQQVAFERLRRNESVKNLMCDKVPEMHCAQPVDGLHKATLREIFEFACRMAGRDLAVFYEACNEDSEDFRARALQSMLIRSVKKSFGDIRSGYLRFVTRQESEETMFAYQEKHYEAYSIG